MKRTRVAALILVLILGTAAAGCGPESRAAAPADDAASASIEASEAAVEPTPEIPPSATAGATGLDPAGLDKELDAMERELDQLEMPSDADFTDAASALP